MGSQAALIHLFEKKEDSRNSSTVDFFRVSPTSDEMSTVAKSRSFLNPTDPISTSILPATILQVADEEHRTDEVVSRVWITPVSRVTALTFAASIVMVATDILDPLTVLDTSLPRINIRSTGSLTVHPNDPVHRDPRAQVVALITVGSKVSNT